MSIHTIAQVELLDLRTLDLEQLAQACGMQAQWLAVRVEAELFGARPGAPSEWRFDGADLVRARRLAQCERMFEVDLDAAAFMADLLETVAQLRHRLRVAGQDAGPSGPELPGPSTGGAPA